MLFQIGTILVYGSRAMLAAAIASPILVSCSSSDDERHDGGRSELPSALGIREMEEVPIGDEEAASFVANVPLKIHKVELVDDAYEFVYQLDESTADLLDADSSEFDVARVSIEVSPCHSRRPTDERDSLPDQAVAGFGWEHGGEPRRLRTPFGPDETRGFDKLCMVFDIALFPDKPEDRNDYYGETWSAEAMLP
jgi:hypothetical protein